MPIPIVTRINPLDLQNVVIGVSLPFNKPFNKTFSTAVQLKSNLINLILTNKGERVFNPQFGTNLRSILFEGINDTSETLIREQIVDNVNLFIPQIDVQNVSILQYPDTHLITISVTYVILINKQQNTINIQIG